jgi:aspartate aminotransferase-like enzyme
MVPGPVDSDDDVLSALSQPTLPHYGPLWMPLFNETTRLLQNLFHTTNDVLMMPGPGTGALDAAVGSLVRPEGSVCIISNGHFGQRAVQIVEAYGLRAWIAEFPLGEAADPDQLSGWLKAWTVEARNERRPIEALIVVHHETSTGVLNPLPEIVQVAHEFDLALLVDAVSSLGGVSLEVDALGVDICVSVPNKCLGGVPGVALMSVSPRAWALAQANPARHGWYHDLRTWARYRKEWGAWHPYPTTLPTNVIVALHQALIDVFEIGLEAYVASHQQAAQRVRDALLPLGFDLFPKPAHAAPTVSAFKTRTDVKVSDLQRFLVAEHDIVVSGGLEELAGKIFRVGHMGRARSAEYGDRLVEAIRAYLEINKLPVNGSRKARDVHNPRL